MMKNADAIKHLLRLADEAETTGAEQYHRSVHSRISAWSDFKNAQSWGQKARAYREAAAELGRIEREDAKAPQLPAMFRGWLQRLGGRAFR